MYKQQSDFPRASHAYGHKSFLIRVIRVCLMYRKHIIKNAFRIGERHPMFLQITRGLRWVELETHNLTICIMCIYVNYRSAETDSLSERRDNGGPGERGPRMHPDRPERPERPGRMGPR